jgi:hypothetical protein
MSRRKSSAWRVPAEPLAYEVASVDHVSVRLSTYARFVPPQRMYGRPDVAPPIWPAALKAFDLVKPRPVYTEEEQALATANGWTVLHGSNPETFGDLSFPYVTRIVKCPSVFIGKDGRCVALLVYGPLLRDDGDLASLGDVVIDILPWAESAFLIRLAPPVEVAVP